MTYMKDKRLVLLNENNTQSSVIFTVKKKKNKHVLIR